MTDGTLVGIDLGTSGVRVAAHDADGSVLAAGSADLDAQTTGAWFDALRRAVPDLPDGPSSSPSTPLPGRSSPSTGRARQSPTR